MPLLTIAATDVPSRVIQVLEDYLPDELNLVDAERGGDATPDVVNFFGGPRPLLDIYPCITVDSKQDQEIAGRGISYDGVGSSQHDLTVEVAAHIQSTGEDTNRMRDLAERYFAGIVRVLRHRYDGLETIADPIRFAMSVTRPDPATFVDEQQGSGALVRSVRIPFRVQVYETL
jgi:hypothetical protein